MKKILLGVHGGATADGAAHVARLLRDRTGASLDVVAVLEPPPILDYVYGPIYIPDAATEDALEEQLRAEVEQQLANCGLGDTRFSVVRGPRASSLAGAAAAREADVIVVGIGPHHLTDRALGGETALHLAQQAVTPVLAVPAPMRALPHRTLAAMDFSAVSLSAARLVASILARGERLELAYVDSAASVGKAVLGPSRSAQAMRRLQQMATEIPVPAGAHVLTSVFAGGAAKTLLDVATQTGAELIALGSHGYSPWRRLLIGSVSSKVLRLAQCAVLIYPARCVASTPMPKGYATVAGVPAA